MPENFTIRHSRAHGETAGQLLGWVASEARSIRLRASANAGLAPPCAVQASTISLQQANQARAAQPGVMAHQPGQGLDVVDEAGIGPIQIAETVQPYVPVERLAGERL